MIDEKVFNEHDRRCLSDTGYFCRRVLGMDRDEDGPRGKGGIRDHGPHQDMVRVLDDPLIKRAIVLMPRNGYKSSIVKGYIIRSILSDPNVTILLCMHDQKMAEERVQVIRDILIKNEWIKEHFGDLKGPIWQKNSFTTSLRNDDTLDAPTLSCCARTALKTGGHHKIVVMDDIIDDQSSKTEEGIESSRRALAYLMPLLTPDGKMVDVGTIYEDRDVHHLILEQPNWHKVIHSVGYELEVGEDRKLRLVGEEPFFTFLSKEMLLGHLGIMGPRVWQSQYKNRLIGTGNEVFRREQFQAVPWKTEFRNLTGYIVTDTAPSEKKEGCYNVIGYLGLDEMLKLYILDLEVGHWQIGEFVDKFFAMRDRWLPRVNHEGECMETITLNFTYRSAMEQRARAKRQQLNLISMSRAGGSNDNSKDQRILRLQPRFRAREVFVCDTVPREFVDLGESKKLWEPEGYIDPETKRVYPSGELVKQFIQFRQWGRSMRDIPDAIAQIDETDSKSGERFCTYRRPRVVILPSDQARTRLDRQEPSSVGFRRLRYRRFPNR